MRGGRLLVVRIVVLGAALIAAAGALAIRVRSSRSDQQAYTQLNGRTDQRYPMWLLHRRGALRSMFVMWHPAKCTGGAVSPWSAMTFDRRSYFRLHGREFAAAEAHYARPDGAWSRRVSLVVTGRLSSDGGSASGVLHGHVAWSRDGQPGNTCDTGAVAWHLAAPQ